MLQYTTKRTIKEHKWDKHANKSQFFGRIKDSADEAFKDLKLLADELEEKQLQEIFTMEKLEPFIQSLMTPHPMKNTKRSSEQEDRIFFLGFMLLRWSLNMTGAILDNKWARELYLKYELPLRNMLNVLYAEKRQKLENLGNNINNSIRN